MKPGKLQRSKQRCQVLCWKVHDHAQSFVLHSYTIGKILLMSPIVINVPTRNKGSFVLVVGIFE